jgi:hypothetical protein
MTELTDHSSAGRAGWLGDLPPTLAMYYAGGGPHGPPSPVPNGPS